MSGGERPGAGLVESAEVPYERATGLGSAIERGATVVWAFSVGVR